MLPLLPKFKNCVNGLETPDKIPKMSLVIFVTNFCTCSNADTKNYLKETHARSNVNDNGIVAHSMMS